RLARLDLAVQLRQVLAMRDQELRANQVAESVGGEAGQLAGEAPVDVLQGPLSVVRRFDPEVLDHLGVPGLRNVLHLEATLEEVVLDLETKQDVEVVSDLVGLDPDQ